MSDKIQDDKWPEADCLNGIADQDYSGEFSVNRQQHSCPSAE
jgi:hypothetical protein